MIILDECTPRRYLRLLREWGYDAELSSSQVAPDATDVEVIGLASHLDAVLLTVDMDFANILNYPPAQYQGIVVVRYEAADEAELDQSVKTALADLYREGLRKTLVIVSAKRYRIRR